MTEEVLQEPRLGVGPPQAWLPVLAWAALISVLSTSSFSALATGAIIKPLLHWLLPAASPMTIELLHDLIRKAAHFTEYAILFWLLARGPLRGRAGLALTVCVLYAMLDEGHQILVPGRTASIFDVGLDFSGALFSHFLRAAIWPPG